MKISKSMFANRAIAAILLIVLSMTSGCGTTRDKLATDQLLLSDAVDRSVAGIDFSPLRGETVYLDTTYVRQVKGAAFVNADYIISSLRQQMVLAGCLLQDNREDADFIAEARVGVLGTDAHDVNYGLPGSQGITAAASLVSGAAPLPSLPEISFARKAEDSAASKIAVFAYHRKSRQPVWQSGLSVAKSSARAKWILGAGPFQSGSIYEGTHFAGGKLRSSPLKNAPRSDLMSWDDDYRNPAVWSEELQSKLYAGGAPAPDASVVARDDSAAEDVESTSDASGEGQVQQAQYTE